MAAPSTTAIATPSGIPLHEGYRAIIVFARLPTASFWVRTVKPPGVTKGEPIDITTQHNVEHTTKAEAALKEWTNAQVVASFDPNLYNNIKNSLLGSRLASANGSVTIHFPDGSTLDFFGWGNNFDFSAFERLNKPEVTFDVVVSNFDPANDVEAGPVLTSVSGT